MPALTGGIIGRKRHEKRKQICDGPGYRATIWMDRARDNADVGASRRDCAHDVRALRLFQIDIDIRVPREESGQHRRNVFQHRERLRRFGEKRCRLTSTKSVTRLPRSAAAMGVARLEAFRSAARGAGFDPNRSDADFLVTFEPATRNDLSAFADLFKRGAGEASWAPGRSLRREALEASRISFAAGQSSKKAETVYG
jgi:hypothetical protein